MKFQNNDYLNFITVILVILELISHNFLTSLLVISIFRFIVELINSNTGGK